jgi:pilus assembly protein Flp/PilA
MGETEPNGRLSDAAGGRAVGRVAARFALRFARDDSGATAVEYGLIITLIFLAIVGAVGSFSTKFITVLNTASTTIGGAL